MKWINILCLILMLVACSSCRTTSVVEPAVVSHDTVYQYRCYYDSIYLHDSIYQFVKEKGDTVFFEKDVYHTEYRDRWHTDSIYIAQCDTVVNIVEVPADITFWQKTEIEFGRLLIVVIIIFVIITFLKRYFTW